MFDRSGNLMVQSRVWPVGAVKIQLKSVAASPSGNLVAVGGAYSESGALAGFIALLDSQGRVTKMVQSAPFLPFQAAVARNGTIWLLGLQPPSDGIHEPLHNVVQQYSPDGRLLLEFLPRSTFDTKRNPAIMTVEGEPFIGTSNDRVGMYLPAMPPEWIEFSQEGKLLSRYRILPLGWEGPPSRPPVPMKLLNGVAYSESGQVYGRFDDASRSGTLFILDKQAKTWRPAETVAKGLGRLVGVDGDSLIFTSATSGNFVWTVTTN
jgi:hypothetical protein